MNNFTPLTFPSLSLRIGKIKIYFNDPETMKLSPEWTELEKKWGSRPSLRGDLAELRTGYDELSNSLRGQAPDDQDDNLDIRAFHPPTLHPPSPLPPHPPGQLLFTWNEIEICGLLGDETIYGGLTLRIYAPEAAKASETLPIGV